MTSKVRSTVRSERMKARWADPDLAAKMRANLRRGHPKPPDPVPEAGDPSAPPPPPASSPKGDAAPAASPFTDRRIFGRHRSSSR
jgi:hypothetical protein